MLCTKIVLYLALFYIDTGIIAQILADRNDYPV